MKLDLNLEQCRGLQTPDERKEALGADGGYLGAVVFVSGCMHEVGSQLETVSGVANPRRA